MDAALLDQCADGATYSHKHDHARLAAQRERVWNHILDREWHTLAEISAATGDPEASVSARLRDFRKAHFGRHVITRRRVEGQRGLYEYRLAS